MPILGNSTTEPSINSKALKPSPVSHARIVLSGGEDTSPISLTTSGVLIHQCADYAVDEVYLWVSNYDSSDRLLTIEVGGDGTFGDNSKTFTQTISKQQGLIQVYPGVPHQNATIYAKSAANSSLNIFGFVLRHYRISISDPELGFDGTE